jgi:hypothetical protein
MIMLVRAMVIQASTEYIFNNSRLHGLAQSAGKIQIMQQPARIADENGYILRVCKK